MRLLPRQLDTWAIAGGLFAVAIFAVLLGQWLLVGAVLVLVAVWAWFHRAQWWPRLKEQLQVWRGAFFRAADRSPTYWSGPPVNDEHAGYRLDYEVLVSRPGRLSRSDLFLIAEIVDGLQGYGDNPLAAPPTIRQRFAGIGGAVGAAAGRWTWIVGAALLAACVALWGWGRALEAERDVACSVHELEGNTTREPCRDLAEMSSAYTELAAANLALEQARAGDVGSQVTQARETQGLNQRRRARETVVADRERRARDDVVESARDARAPNWDQRLRDVTTPLPLFAPGDGTGAGAGAAGGVSDGSAGAPGVSDPVTAGGPGGSDGSAGEPGSADGERRDADPVP